MSLKNIRENYARLLTSFKEVGVKLTESQKKDIDNIILALESQTENTKRIAIDTTRRIVERELGKEYRTVLESILCNMQKHSIICGKIQNKISSINESKKIANSVDRYLDVVLKEALPKKDIVDYHRLNKLESVFESLKDIMLINDSSVEAKRKELTESFENENKDLKDEIAKLKSKLNESISREKNLVAINESIKAKNLLVKKTKDLPLFESQQIRRRFANATCEEIEKNFKKVLECVREDMKNASIPSEKSLEEEINNIIANESSKEKTRIKDADKEIKESDDEETKTNGDSENDSDNTQNESETLDDDDVNDDIQLSESEKIPSGIMKLWISKVSSINPIG